jgi:hypothetical protein
VEEMDGDEVLAWLASGVLALMAAKRWYGALLGVTPLGGSRTLRSALVLLPLGCLALVFAVLVSWSAKEVRTDHRYVLLFLTAAVAWLGAGGLLIGFLGVSIRDDAIEGRNASAAWTVSGGLLGTALCYAGSNIGEDPSIWTTFVTAVAATAALFALWLALELSCHVSEAVTLDRDSASGARLAGVLIGAGLILGRAGAGDWKSAENMLRDLAAKGWPAALVVLAGGVLHQRLRPVPTHPSRDLAQFGILPAVVVIAASVGYVLFLGRW